MRQLAAKLTKPLCKIKNPLYLQVIFHFYTMLRNCRETPRNPFRFWQVSQSFGRVSRQLIELEQTLIIQGRNHFFGEVLSVSRQPEIKQLCDQLNCDCGTRIEH